MADEKSSVKGLGIKLLREREAREVTLEEISKSTKISKHLLHAIESDDWNALPGGIFTRNFIRLYADYLGLDAERYVDEYLQFIKIKDVAEKSSTSQDLLHSDDDERSAMSPGMLVSLILVPVILLIGGYLAISYLPSNVDQPVEAQPQQKLDVSESATVATGEAAIVSEDPMNNLTIELTEKTVQSCRFQAWADESMITPEGGDNLILDQVRTFSASEKLSLYLGHINGVELKVNGQIKSLNDYLVRRLENGTAVIEIVVDSPAN
jgi:cytoskeletal protein RodZ